DELLGFPAEHAAANNLDPAQFSAYLAIHFRFELEISNISGQGQDCGASRRCLTIALTFLPSTSLPAKRDIVCFMTIPISFAEAAPVERITSSTTFAISSSETAAG